MILNTNAFDVDEPEGTSKSIHLSKKDVKFFLIALVILAALMVPIYIQLKMTADQHLCKQNMEQIGKAIGLYAVSNDDRLPPVYATAGPQVPYVDEKGHPFTWTTLVSRFMNGRANFVCPSAQDDEKAVSQHPDSSKLSLESTYGMYVPLGGYAISHVQNPDVTTLVAETSNEGSQGSFDPFPYEGLAGNRGGQDGFAIGWSNGNDAPSKSTVSVTRLAYRETASGDFKMGIARHKAGIFFLSVSGSLHMAPPNAAKVTMHAGEIQGNWWAPPSEDQ